MRIRHLKIRNFRGIKEANLSFPKEQRVLCLIGAGDTTKTSILTAIEYALWPNWNLQINTSDFYNCNLEECIVVEVSVDEIPDELLTDNKYGLYLRGDVSAENDEPMEGEEVLTVRLTVDDNLEPTWNVVCNRLEAKLISQGDRQKIAVGYIGTDVKNRLNWGRGSVLGKYIDPRSTIKRSLSSLEEKSNEIADFTELDEIGMPLNMVAQGYGVKIDGNINNRLVLKSTNTLSEIEVFEDSRPLNQRGLGSQKLLNVGLQIECKDEQAVVLIDEIEIGLEPYRQRNLIHILKKHSESAGQVIFTTHSPTSLVEMTNEQLLIVHSNDGITIFQRAYYGNPVIDNGFQAALRRYAEAFLSPKIIVCEGKTEVGFIRTVDENMIKNDSYSMASMGVAYIEAGGNSDALMLADKFDDLGYKVCVLCDNDRPEDEMKKQHLISKGISIFQWQSGRCLETEWIPLFSEAQLVRIVEYIEEQNKTNVLSLLRNESIIDDNNAIFLIDDKKLLRLATICKERSVFKNIDGGEEFGKYVIEVLDLLEDTIPAKIVMKGLKKWICEWSE